MSSTAEQSQFGAESLLHNGRDSQVELFVQHNAGEEIIGDTRPKYSAYFAGTVAHTKWPAGLLKANNALNAPEVMHHECVTWPEKPSSGDSELQSLKRFVAFFSL